MAFRDNILPISLKSPTEVLGELRERFKRRRLALNLTQEGLSKRSGVALASLRRFERTGLISLDSLLKLALVLDCLADFDKVAGEDDRSLIGQPLDAVLAQKPGRRKGRIK